MRKFAMISAVLTACLSSAAVLAGPPNGVVTITPLGSNAGEFCGADRAMLFQDPSGVNILIQPGRTVDGAGDARLDGIDVHAILLDHTHNDHIGEQIVADADATVGNGCALIPTADFTVAGPLFGIPNIAQIAAGKDSAILVGAELVPWLRDRTAAAEGAAVGGCGGYNTPGSGLTNLTEVKRTSPCVDVLRPGASRELQLDGAATSVRVSTVQAVHSNGIDPRFTADASKFPTGITAYGGTETGYVIRFSNGLSVYWSGDSGFFGDMALFSDFYKVNLAIPHIGDAFTMGPDEAAFAINKLIKPRSVIPTHANEGATTGGTVNVGTRTERFIDQVNSAKVFVPLSGVLIECDGQGKCSQ